MLNILDGYDLGMNSVLLTISVVSHGQIDLIESLLHDIDEHCRTVPIELILTLNLEEALPFAADSFSFPIKVVEIAYPCN